MPVPDGRSPVMTLIAVLALYVVFLGIGVASARRTREGAWSELLVAGRALPLWLAVLTMTATWVDGGYLLGTVEGTFKSGIPLGAQGGVCFGISLVLGGLFFARRMRALEFTTLIDPFEARYGRHWALALSVPALLGEVFWSAELLVWRSDRRSGSCSAFRSRRRSCSPPSSSPPTPSSGASGRSPTPTRSSSASSRWASSWPSPSCSTRREGLRRRGTPTARRGRRARHCCRRPAVARRAGRPRRSSTGGTSA